MQRKGQAAMEFLMTYGWAILAAIIAIGVLAYFGVFSPARLVGSSAIMNPPLGVDAFNIVNDDATCGTGFDCIHMEILQNAGEALTITAASISLTSGGTGTCTDTTALPAAWASGTEQTFDFDCGVATAWAAGATIAGDITITYTQAGSTLAQVSTGTLRGTTQ
jgi:hypothetical protein